jgi:RimJ/RimL family protein N-acetyltransferase
MDGLITRKCDNVVVGDLGLKGGPNEAGTAELGFGILPQFRGMGYATEMAKAAVTWAFEEGGVARIVAECLKDNRGSIRVLEKAGMRHCGSNEEMLLWELTLPLRP